jgi:hypothetical protein
VSGNRLYATSYAVRDLSKLSESRYDAVLAAVGYEQRSREISLSIGETRQATAVPFQQNRVEAYEENYAAFAELGFELPEVSEEREREFARNWLSERCAGAHLQRQAHIAVDISSMNRLRIASLIEALANLQTDVHLIVDLLYMAADYRPSTVPATGTLGIKPVTPFFAGWMPDLDKPTLVLLGLGYEIDAADGVVEYLDPDDTLAWIPLGFDQRYLDEVRRANESLARAEEDRVYRIEDPYSLLLDLDREVAHRRRRARVMIVPLGPKIFAAISMLVATAHRPAVSVWRVRHSDLAPPVDRRGNGRVCGIRVSNRPFSPVEG